MNIPVFHDDQHGTAIIVLAGLINACELTNKKKEDVCSTYLNNFILKTDRTPLKP